MEIGKLVPHCTRDAQGIWQANNGEPVSYPAEGNQLSFGLEERSYWFRHRNACITSLVERIPPRGPIVDVGGGNGFVTQGLIAAGFEAVLLEPGPEGARLGKTHRGLPHVICASLRGVGFAPGSLPAVGLFDVLEHLEDDRGALADLSRALEPEGLLYGTVPAYPWLWSSEDDYAQHHRRYTRTSLGEVLSREFDVLYASYFFRSLLLPLTVLRVLPDRLKLRGSTKPGREHGVEGGPAVALLSRLLAREQRQLAEGATLGWGASLLFAARKR